MRPNKSYKILMLIFCLSVSLTFSVIPVLAAGPDTTAIVSRFANIYNTLRSIGIAAAVVSLAITGILYLRENEQAAAKARSAAIIIIIALIAMYVLPYAVGKGVSWGKAHAWDPPH